jgi:hypothetical protein
MPKRNDISSVFIIGTRPIMINQICKMLSRMAIAFLLLLNVTACDSKRYEYLPKTGEVPATIVMGSVYGTYKQRGFEALLYEDINDKEIGTLHLMSVNDMSISWNDEPFTQYKIAPGTVDFIGTCLIGERKIKRNFYGTFLAKSGQVYKISGKGFYETQGFLYGSEGEVTITIQDAKNNIVFKEDFTIFNFNTP